MNSVNLVVKVLLLKTVFKYQHQPNLLSRVNVIRSLDWVPTRHELKSQDGYSSDGNQE